MLIADFDLESSRNWNVLEVTDFRYKGIKNHDAKMSEYVPVAKQKKLSFTFFTRHCQSVLILWHFDCSLDFFNFSLRGTKIHPKKPAFLRPIKSFIFLKYLPSRISKFPGPPANQEGGQHPLGLAPY